jgi:hypothetical protein
LVNFLTDFGMSLSLLVYLFLEFWYTSQKNAGSHECVNQPKVAGVISRFTLKQGTLKLWLKTEKTIFL